MLQVLIGSLGFFLAGAGCLVIAGHYKHHRLRALPVFFSALMLMGITSGCALPESSAAATPTQEEEVPGEPPVVAGPNEKGLFPSMTEAEFRAWVKSDFDTVPATPTDSSEVTPFMQTTGKLWLETQYPSINDWQVLYEFSDYVYTRNSYDPYQYAYHNMWMPLRIVILATQQSQQFDRLVVVAKEKYAVKMNPGETEESATYQPSVSSGVSQCHGWESQLQIGDISSAELRTISGYESFPSLYLSDGKVLLLDYNSNNMILLRDVPSEQTIVLFSMEPVDGIEVIPGRSSADRMMFAFHQPCAHVDYDSYYYSAAEQKAYPFAESGTGSQDFKMAGGHMALLSADRVCLYDITAADPGKPYLVLGGKDHGGLLSDGDIHVFYQLATQRENPDHYAFMYFKEDERQWRICTIDTEGNILCDFSTELPVIDDHVSCVQYTKGLVYFIYYSGGKSSAPVQYCIDARADVPHNLQMVE